MYKQLSRSDHANVEKMCKTKAIHLLFFEYIENIYTNSYIFIGTT